MNKPKLRLIELFNGISAQYRGILNTNLFDCEMIATSDIDHNVIVECAAIHCGLTNEMIENYTDYPSKEEMAQSLTDRRIGYDFQKDKQYDWFKLAKKKKGMDLEKYWLAAKLTNNLGDVSKIDKLPACDILTFSSPCTDYSIAGKQEGSFNTCNACGHKFNPFDYDVEERYNCPNCGSDDIQGTRSGLLKEVERLLINSIKVGEAPKYLLQENVDALVSKKFKPDFEAFCRRLENLNYSVYWTVLNAKECGIPQNRRRLFMIGIRKDIDTGKFTFPLPFDTGIRLKDILEKNVDEKYYINTERASNLIQQLVDKGQLKGQRACCDSTINDPNVRDVSNAIIARYDAGISNYKQTGLAVAEPNANIENQPILVKNKGEEYVKDLDNSVTLMARDWKGWNTYGSTAIVESEIIDKAERIGGMFDDNTKHQAGSVWNTNGLAPTLDTMQGGLRQPCVVETNQNNNIETQKSIWKDINSHYKISSKGVVVDVINKCKVEETDGKVELEVKGNMAKFPIKALMNKYFPENTDTTKPEEKEVIGIKQATKKGYIECELPGCADLSYPSSTTRRGRVQDNGQTSPTITATETGVHYIESIYRIRKLTVRECFALMGFTFEDWDKCAAIGISNSAGYKAAGNSIVTNCISLLFEHLYKAQYDESYICTDEKMQNFQKPEVE